ncbi:GNAT family N-acetyltransferase [Aliihoeflea sp. PC F10.4]
MTTAIVKLSDRPELAAITARWRWDAFFREDGIDLFDIQQQEKIAAARDDLFPTVLVLLDDEQPVGMVALCLDDLDGRPDLNPWLAGLYVEPAHRGRGHSRLLIEALEAFALTGGIDQLWLYTASAQELYEKAGWQTAETFEKGVTPFSIMRKNL